MITFKDFLEEGVNDPGIFKAIFLAGGPGSGKSFVASQTIPRALGLKMVNSDDVFELGMKKSDLSLSPEDITSPKGQEIRAKAKKITNFRMELYKKGRLGLIIDGTGKDYDKISKQVDNLRKLGYDCYMIFVNTSKEVALERNKLRPRSLPDDMVVKLWNRVQENIGKFQRKFGNANFTVVDNNDAKENILQMTFKDVRKFVSKAIENRIAKKWIEDQKK